MLAIFYETVHDGTANTSGAAGNCHYFHDDFACGGENVGWLGAN
jgi:hypothetical protein